MTSWGMLTARLGLHGKTLRCSVKKSVLGNTAAPKITRFQSLMQLIYFHENKKNPCILPTQSEEYPWSRNEFLWPNRLDIKICDWLNKEIFTGSERLVLLWTQLMRPSLTQINVYSKRKPNYKKLIVSQFYFQNQVKLKSLKIASRKSR